MLHEKLEIYQNFLVDAAVWAIEPHAVDLLVEVVGRVQFIDVFCNTRPRNRLSTPTHLLVGSDLLNANPDSRAPRG